MTLHTFLSYHSGDKPAVEAIAQRLMQEGIEPWFDTWNLVPGEFWQNEIEAALVTCASCCVFLGPSGLGPWQHAEMRAAIDRRNKEKDFRVIPVLLPGAQRGERSKLPTFLSQATWVEFRQSLDDEDCLHRLKCGILGIQPGPNREEPIHKGVCPYRGLQVFDVEHAPFFFGRQALTEWLLEDLRSEPGRTENRFLAIIGASGSGKSSLARAGLLAVLRRGALAASDRWPIFIIKPGSDPLESLAIALASDAQGVPPLKATFRTDANHLHVATRFLLRDRPETERVVLLVDQFEEVFSLCRDPNLRQAFIDNLLHAGNEVGGQTLVLLTMRADFYSRCAEYETLAASLADHQLLVGPMNEKEVREAIVAPAATAGCEFDPVLVQVLIQDVKGQPGGLPLLEYALTQLWEHRQGRRFNLADYDAIGRLEGALEQRVNALYGSFNKAEKEACRQIFLRLTEPGEGTEDTRRRTTARELGDAEATTTALRKLTEARLITAEGSAEQPAGVVEVAHEALIRNWSLLRRWVEADRDALRTQHRLSEAASEWEKHNRDVSYLYRGSRLATAWEWAQTRNVVISRVEDAFLQASIDLEDSEERQRQEQQQTALTQAKALATEEARSAQRRKRLNQVIGAGLIIAVAIATYAGWQQWQAEEAKVQAEANERVARRQQKVALARQLAAQAQLIRDLRAGMLSRSTLLSIESLNHAHSVEGMQALRSALAGQICSPLR